MTNQSQAVSNAGESKNHMPLMALGGVAVLLAAFFVAMNPRMVEIHARAQAQLAEEIARENTAFCEKRGFAAGVSQHTACVSDLNELRAKQDKRTHESVIGML